MTRGKRLGKYCPLAHCNNRGVADALGGSPGSWGICGALPASSMDSALNGKGITCISHEPCWSARVIVTSWTIAFASCVGVAGSLISSPSSAFVGWYPVGGRASSRRLILRRRFRFSGIVPPSGMDRGGLAPLENPLSTSLASNTSWLSFPFIELQEPHSN